MSVTPLNATIPCFRFRLFTDFEVSDAAVDAVAQVPGQPAAAGHELVMVAVVERKAVWAADVGHKSPVAGADKHKPAGAGVVERRIVVAAVAAHTLEMATAVERNCVVVAAVEEHNFAAVAAVVDY